MTAPTAPAVSVVDDHLSPVVGACRGCERPMVTPIVFQRVAKWRRTGHVRLNGLGMCVTCYSRARRRGTLPDPATPAAKTPTPRVVVRRVYEVQCNRCGVVVTRLRRGQAEAEAGRHRAECLSALAAVAR